MITKRIFLSTVLAVCSFASVAQAAGYAAPVIGQTEHYQTKYEDTVVQIARANDLGYIELLAANPGLDPWLPGNNVDITLPKEHILPDAPHTGIVINLPEMRIFYYGPNGEKPVSHPIGIGRAGLLTPVGHTTVRAKAHDFDWRPTPRMRAEDPSLPEVVGPGPDNPMGAYVLYLSWPEYGIHGTNKPYGIGRRSSSGCIRLYPEDIESLWPHVPVNTGVTVVNEPVLAAWIGNTLYVEAHPTMDQADAMEKNIGAPLTYEMSDADMRTILKTAGGSATDLDWTKVRQVVRERRGYPIAVLRKAGAASQADDSSGSDL